VCNHLTMSLPVHQQWSCSPQYARTLVCRSHAFGPCFLFPRIFNSKKSFLIQFYLEMLQPYPLNWYKFFINTLSTSPNSMLYYRYFVTVLKKFLAKTKQYRLLLFTNTGSVSKMNTRQKNSRRSQPPPATDYVMSSITESHGPFDFQCAISYRCSIVTESVSPVRRNTVLSSPQGQRTERYIG